MISGRLWRRSIRGAPQLSSSRQTCLLHSSCGARWGLYKASRTTTDFPARAFAIRSFSDGNYRQTSENERKPPTVEDEFDPKELFRDQNNTWVDNKMPHWIQPYCKIMRIDRPIGTWLLLWPSLWSISLAAPAGEWPDLHTLFLFAVGAFVMRGAGCTINDMWDMKFDKQVARTTQRPLAAGTMTPFQALCFLGVELSCGLAVLLQLNWFSIQLGALALIPVTLYPLAKRFTYWPQIVLGLAFNWGAMLGWAAVTGWIAWDVVMPLYLSCISWTVVYDTIYAHQDKEDDKKLGLKSTALLLGEQTPRVLTGFATLMCSGLAVAGYNDGLAWPFYAGLGGAYSHLLWQVWTADYEDRWSCTNRFVSNAKIGALIFLAIVLGGKFSERKRNSCSFGEEPKESPHSSTLIRES
eukprot:gb/GECG01012575.1/.p1 GENE.gb/GECG01012575.1/~~gb/GECG01012575.1/.p1  ORF type:complete len:410 (+),score=17.07 gb/GECG01012575.1/:1-1230(+)